VQGSLDVEAYNSHMGGNEEHIPGQEGICMEIETFPYTLAFWVCK